MMTAISTASGKVNIMVESSAPINHSPHHDIKLLKIPIKNDRISDTIGKY